jgi:ketosteroid isomerase-like protein
MFERNHTIHECDSFVLHETTDPEVIIIGVDVTGESASGEPYRLPYIQVLRAGNGAIVSFRDSWNPLAFVSLLPSVGSGAEQSSH